MWDLQLANPLGRLSMRKLLSFVAALLVTIFAYILTAAPVAHAADAAWNGGNLSYKSNQYNAMADAKAGDSTEIPEGSKVFGYSTDPVDGPVKAYLIYFDPGVDPKTATSAKAVNYDYTPPNTYSNKSSVETISVDSSSANNAASSCTVEGIGWIVCSVSTFLAQGMDWVFSQLVGFVAVQPIQSSNQEGDLYKTWNIIRSFANVIFIISFLIIIYSQLTSTGVSNYGIKKLLPRLIIAAVLVNVSYYICAAAVDISNILGYSLQHIFIQIREDLFHIHGNTWTNNTGNWESVTAYILSGGAAAIVLTGGALMATGGTITAGVFLLLPMLLSLMLVILVVLLILAARQAIIVILIIISPLAFVAYLLPGTEKWFEKWKDLFMTMLIFFPAFSMVFGGAQLAGAVIIQNAASINMMILGLAVQVAPLAIAPLLLKLSGGFLNRIAGIVNNPGKGLVDRSKKWAGEQAEYHRQRGTSGAKWNGDPGQLRKRNFARRAARALDHRKRDLADRTKNMTSMTDNAYHASEKYAKSHEVAHQVDTAKQRIENELKTHIQQKINMTGSRLNIDNVNLEASKIILEKENNKTSSDIKEYRTGHAVYTGELGQAISSMKDSVIQNAAQVQRGQAAANMEQKMVASAFNEKDDKGEITIAANALLKVAAGIDPAGRVRAQANASVALNKIEAEALDNSVKLLQSEAFSLGKTLKAYSNDIAIQAISGANIDQSVIEAAFEAQAQEGNMLVFEQARGTGNIDQASLSKIIAKNAGTFKAKGGFHLQANPDLAFEKLGDNFDEMMGSARMGSLGDTVAANIKELKAGWLQDVASNIERDIQHAKASGNTRALKQAYESFNLALTNEDIRGTINDRVTEVEKIRNALRAEGFDR